MSKINILLMDAMGAIENIIKQPPVRLMLNYPFVNENEEIFFTITLTNPDNRLTAKFIGILDFWMKDFAPLLPIRSIKGEWTLKIELSGSLEKTEIYSLILNEV